MLWMCINAWGMQKTKSIVSFFCSHNGTGDHLTGFWSGASSLLYGLFRPFIVQYKNPAIPPKTKPAGPVMKMPRRGP